MISMSTFSPKKNSAQKLLPIAQSSIGSAPRVNRRCSYSPGNPKRHSMPQTDAVDMEKMMMKIRLENEKTIREVAAEERKIKAQDSRGVYSGGSPSYRNTQSSFGILRK